MACKRTYSCDLCHTVFEPDSSFLFGIAFGHDGYDGFVRWSPLKVDQHLCKACLKDAATMLSDIEKEGA